MPSTPSNDSTNKRPALDDALRTGDAMDQLVAMRTQLELQANAAAQQTTMLQDMLIHQQQQQELMRQQLMMMQQQQQHHPQPTELQAAAAAASPGQVTGAQPTAADNQPPKSAEIEKKIADTVKQVTASLNTHNNAQAAVKALSALQISDDPDTPLPSGLPNAATAIANARQQLPFGADMLENVPEAERKEAQLKVDKPVRLAVIAYVAQLISIKTWTVQKCETDISQQETALETEVKSLLADTIIPEGDKAALLKQACTTFQKQKRAVITKIETRRKAAEAEKAKLARELEEAKLAQLEQDAQESVGQFIDQKIVAAIERRGSMSMDEIPAQKVLRTENLQFEEKQKKKEDPKNGKAPRAALAARQPNQKGQNESGKSKSQRKGKGKQAALRKGKGRGGGKHAGGRGEN